MIELQFILFLCIYICDGSWVMMILQQHASTAQFYLRIAQKIDALRGEKFIFNGAYFKTKILIFFLLFYELL